MKLSPQLAVAGMIFFGTLCSLLAKLIYCVPVVNVYGETSRYEKPWLQVLAMFAGMSICILLDPPQRRNAGSKQEEEHLLTRDRLEGTNKLSAASVWIIGIPTLFDLFATACGTTGLLYTTVSVYQMLRGAMLIWTAVFSVLFLRTSLTRYHYVGIVQCVVGIILVGLANVWAEKDVGSRRDTLFGIGVILLGQVLQAAQVVIEEFLLQGLEMSSVRIVAWEGVFGMMHCIVWVFPLVYLLPGSDHGHLEDVFDAFYMLTHSLPIAAIVATDMIMMLFYNVCGMEVTDSLSAVHRVIIETLRTLCVWLVDLAIFYGLSDGQLGESWTKYSWLQLVGFIFLVVGTIVYNYENLEWNTSKAKEEHTNKTHISTTTQVMSYDAVQDTISNVQSLAKPIAIRAELIDSEDRAGSFYGNPVGSVAHSPFLASGHPHSLTEGLHRVSASAYQQHSV